jgi:putative ABC transport system substrate-binding protein
MAKALGLMRLIGLAVMLALSLTLVPLATSAQQSGKVYRIGWLAGFPLEAQERTRPGSSVVWRAFTDGLRDLGWVENQNFVFVFRYAEGKAERYPRLAAELVALKPDILGTGQGELAIRALKQATATIPIVMPVSGDPVGSGLVDSLARPAGNVTGLSILAPAVGAKRLQLLKEVVPNASRVAVLWNAGDPSKDLELKDTEAAARALAIGLEPVGVRGSADFDKAFTAIVRARPNALVVFSDPLTLSHLRQIGDFVTSHRLPMISEIKEFAGAGAVMTYGASLPDLFRRAAVYVDKILKGAKPADLPIEQPTKFELVINLKTAKALGLTIPPPVLVRADEVIQ